MASGRAAAATDRQTPGWVAFCLIVRHRTPGRFKNGVAEMVSPIIKDTFSIYYTYTPPFMLIFLTLSLKRDPHVCFSARYIGDRVTGCEREDEDRAQVRTEAFFPRLLAPTFFISFPSLSPRPSLLSLPLSQLGCLLPPFSLYNFPFFSLLPSFFHQTVSGLFSSP